MMRKNRVKEAEENGGPSKMHLQYECIFNTKLQIFSRRRRRLEGAYLEESAQHASRYLLLQASESHVADQRKIRDSPNYSSDAMAIFDSTTNFASSCNSIQSGLGAWFKLYDGAKKKSSNGIG